MTAPAESASARQRMPTGGTGVSGERGLATVARALSLQARISNWLATGVMLLIGGGLLVWYYGHQLSRGSRSRHELAGGPASQANTEMRLPPLGPIELANAAGNAAPGGAGVIAVAESPVSAGMADAGPIGARPAGSLPAGLAASGAAPMPRPPAMLPAIAPLALMPALAEAPSNGLALRQPAAGGVRALSASERRMSGSVYVGLSAAPSAPSATPVSPASPVSPPSPAVAVVPAALTLAGAASMTAGRGAQPAVGLSAPMATPTAARLLGPQSLLLPKGTSIDCTLETAIDSTLPGMTRCLTATDTFGADGRVVLLERGTELVGETQGQVQQGSARVFVLWSEARTPEGVIVPLESPGADELGRAGLPGTVQRHFWERFGAAILVSAIDGAVQAGVQASSQNSGTVIYNPGASQDVMTEVLKSTVAIPPTVRKANGDRIQVLVARDVDFADVYELRPAGGAR